MCKENDASREKVFCGTWIDVAERMEVLMQAGVDSRRMESRREGKAWWGLYVDASVADQAYEALGLVRRDA